MKKDPSLDLLNAAAELGYEARGATGDHAALKLWLRMLSCTNQIEAEIRRRLRVRFDTSLPRFDYLAQLYREPDGLRNVTGVTDELERDGLVARSSSPSDRRSWIVRLTPKGRQQFEAMALEHEQWILELFSCLNASAVAQVHQQLGSLRVHVLDKQSGTLY